jgi:cell division septum initiation protein DivIVA
MSELMRRVDRAVVNRRTAQELTRLTTETRMEQARLRANTRAEQAAIQAVSMVGEFAVSEVEYLKSVQRRAESTNVDAADAVAAIVNLTVASIARRVARFGQEVDW